MSEEDGSMAKIGLEDMNGVKDVEGPSQLTQARSWEASQSEQTWRQAIVSNPRSLLWCSYALFTCIMWGYDGLASGIVLAIGQFRHDYGTFYDGDYVITAIWQLALGGGSLFGLLFGGMGAGYVAKRWGRQLCMGLSYIFTIVGVFLQWYSVGSLPILFGGKVLTGIPLGVFITIAPTYCSEIAPFALRGAVTAAVNFSIVLGQCIAYVVMRQTQYMLGPSSYRTLFAVQWPFAIFALAVLPFFPESPYHLVAQGRLTKARINARKLHNDKFDVDGYIASVQLDLETHARVAKEASFAECFRGKNRLRTLIATSTFFIQAVSGVTWIIGYMAYFLQLGGLSAPEAFNATVGLSFLSLVGNMAGWWLVEYFGRRNTALWGSISLAVSLFMIGITSLIPNGIWAQVFFMACWSFLFQSTIGSVSWPIISEVSSSSLRGHTQALATVTQGLVGAVSGVSLPFLVNPDKGNLGGKIGFIYGTILAVSCIGVFFYYPETKGRTYGEIDRLFEMGVPPREFKGTVLARETDD